MAPIAITVYNRLDHLQKCINNLLICPEAHATDLFISSDFPKNEIDIPIVLEIRKYIQDLKGFKTVNFLFFESNVGLLNAYNELFNTVFNQDHEQIIFLEDDILVKPDFLNFMNKALDYYKDDSRIIGISGFSQSMFFPVEKQNINGVYFTNRWCPWGFASWKSKINNIPQYDSNQINIRLKDATFVKSLDEIGIDLVPVFKRKLVKNQSLVMDYLNTFFMVDKSLYMVAPFSTKTLNIGNDGKGSRTRKNNKYIIANAKEKMISVHFDLVPFDIDRINNSFNYRVNNTSINRIKIYLDRLGLLQLGYAFAEWKKKKK
jgi:hypothetical protein